MIQYNTEITQEDLNILIDIVMESPEQKKKRKNIKLVGIILAVVSAVFAMSDVWNERITSACFWLILAGLFVWISTSGANFYYKALSKNIQDENQLKSVKRQYVFDEEGIQLTIDQSSNNYAWNTFVGWGCYKNYIYIKRKDQSIILVNKEELSSSDLTALKILLKNHLKEI